MALAVTNMSHENLENLLKEFALTEVYFGGEGFRICAVEELPEAQLGYSKHPNGTDLTGKNAGDWKKEWVIVGNDTELGDPYFVDTSNSMLPVLTAMHGAGSWEPNEVSPSLRNFLSCLAYLRSISTQDNSLIEPNDSTIKKRKELKALETKLSELNGEAYFWNCFFERYSEWLKENDS